MKGPKVFFIAAILILLLIFLIQNLQMVEVQLLIWTIELPRSFLLLAVLFIGALLGYISSLFLSKKGEK